MRGSSEVQRLHCLLWSSWSRGFSEGSRGGLPGLSSCPISDVSPWAVPCSGSPMGRLLRSEAGSLGTLDES